MRLDAMSLVLDNFLISKWPAGTSFFGLPQADILKHNALTVPFLLSLYYHVVASVDRVDEFLGWNVD